MTYGLVETSVWVLSVLSLQEIPSFSVALSESWVDHSTKDFSILIQINRKNDPCLISHINIAVLFVKRSSSPVAWNWNTAKFLPYFNSRLQDSYKQNIFPLNLNLWKILCDGPLQAAFLHKAILISWKVFTHLLVSCLSTCVWHACHKLCTQTDVAVNWKTTQFHFHVNYFVQ